MTQLTRPPQTRNPWCSLASCLVICLLSMAQMSDAFGQTRPPNIVWIVAENVDLDFGCYGATQVATPNVDSLAGDGVRFTNAFSTSPVCAPSRSALMTGMYATTTDMHHMRSHRDDGFRLPKGVRPITHLLQDAGYQTANVTHIGDRVVGTGKLDLNFTKEGELYQASVWSQLDRSKPFFAQFNMPEAEYDIYDRKSAEKDRVVWVGEEWHPQVANEQNVQPPPYYPDHPVVRQEWARYLNSVSGMDVRIGWILDQLKADEVFDNTVIFFFGDNGRLEARGIHWCYDSGLHVPIVVRWPSEGTELPNGFSPGQKDERVVSLIDLTATTLAAAGIEIPISMQGRPLWSDDGGAERRYAFSARDRIDETAIRQRSVRGRRYHYIRNFTEGAGFPTLNRYKEKCFLVKPLMRELELAGTLSGAPADLMRPFPTEMLFDTEADRFEIENLAESDNLEHQAALGEMRAALDVWMVETGDRGHLSEPEQILTEQLEEMDEWFGTPDWFSSGKKR